MTRDNRTRLTLDIEITDLPMILHAIAIARNAALMSGRRDAAARLEHYQIAPQCSAYSRAAA